SLFSTCAAPSCSTRERYSRQHVEMGNHFLRRRTGSGVVWLWRHSSRRRGDRQDPLRRLPGLGCNIVDHGATSRAIVPSAAIESCRCLLALLLEISERPPAKPCSCGPLASGSQVALADWVRA